MRYSQFIFSGVLSLSMAFAMEALAAGSLAGSSIGFSAGEQEPVLLAKRRGGRRRGKAAATREKNIVREKTYRGSKKKIDFDAIDITGERKTPLGTALGGTKASKEFDLIRIRWRWHAEMVQSTSSLETGRSR